MNMAVSCIFCFLNRKRVKIIPMLEISLGCFTNAEEYLAQPGRR